MSKYPWKWLEMYAIGGQVFHAMLLVPPDTARRRLRRRRDMETLAWVVREAKRMGKAVR